MDPPPNIAWALQLGRDKLARPTVNTRDRISFDFSVDLLAGNSPAECRLRGPAVQGRPGERFVYLCIGAYAGQAGAAAGWRARISLEGITASLVDAVKKQPGSLLEARIPGTAPDGGPSRASVPLLGDGWRVA